MSEVSVWSTAGELLHDPFTVSKPNYRDAEPCLGIFCACLPTMTPLLRKCKLIKSEDSSRARRYYEDYHEAANDVSNNSDAKDNGIHSSVRRTNSEDSSTRILRESQSGTSAAKSQSFLKGFPRVTYEPEEENVYAMTTIDVETHRTSKR